MKQKPDSAILAAIIGGVFLIIVTVIGIIFGKTIIQVVYPSGVTLTSTAVARTTPTNRPPTATPSPTPTAKVITINQTMSCTDCTSTENYSLMVKNATVDPASGKVTMLIGVQNNTTSTHYLGFNFLKLQDMQTGDTTDGTGDGFSEFIITANQLILLRPTFQFVPIAGRQYSLSTRMSLNDFTPITIKF